MIIILVGLPGRGKSSVSKKIYNYFYWLGYNIKVFNAGNLRRFKGILQDDNNDINEKFLVINLVIIGITSQKNVFKIY